MLIIFDCDGVLRSVSWPALHEAYLAISKFLEKNPQDIFGREIDEFKVWFDSDWRNNLERMGVIKGSDTSEINKIFHEIYDPQIYTFPWVKKTLKDLAMRHQLAVLSASSVYSVRKSLDGSSSYISLILGYEQVKMIKPHPEGIELIMEKIRSTYDETLIIGDTEADIAAGKNAGIKTAGVVWGLTEREKELADLNPDFLFRDPEELLKL